MSLYLVPTTFEHARSKKNVYTPFLLDAIGIIGRIATWSVLRNDQWHRQCQTGQECTVRILSDHWEWLRWSLSEY
ncbi:hypothetical protein CLAIMM_10653 [Cladophialophora immunda]|nr:hypothetical protein CLAIMM_10653 [Cladophialophora immunda]